MRGKASLFGRLYYRHSVTLEWGMEEVQSAIFHGYSLQNQLLSVMHG